jgi:2-polyprenyl-3-methyl-5-hydroxy-6-metoxy-1,4-benzoquinol methylase
MTTITGLSGDLHTMVRRELVARQLAEHMTRLRDRGPLRVLDVGCGPASPGILLARAGHIVTSVNTDTDVLTTLHEDLAQESADVQGRMRLVEGDGAEAGRHFPPGSFDLAICHDVLEAQPEPDGMLAALARMMTQGGLVSVTSRNAGSLAMRAGAAAQWTATLKALSSTTYPASGGGTWRADTVESLSTVLSDLGAPVLDWYGVGVFSGLQPEDAEPPRGQKAWQNLLACEEDASRRDPYRRIAPVVHLVAEKTVR